MREGSSPQRKMLMRSVVGVGPIEQQIVLAEQRVDQAGFPGAEGTDEDHHVGVIGVEERVAHLRDLLLAQAVDARDDFQ